jgi:hypothetical protein
MGSNGIHRGLSEECQTSIGWSTMSLGVNVLMGEKHHCFLP